MDDYIIGAVWVLIGVFLLVGGMALGFDVARDEITEDCQDFGSFSVRDRDDRQVFSCSPSPEKERP